MRIPDKVCPFVFLSENRLVVVQSAVVFGTNTDVSGLMGTWGRSRRIGCVWLSSPVM